LPARTLRDSFELETRNKYTKVACDVTIKVDGRELPNMAILGEALTEAIEMIQQKITASYQIVPVRDGATSMGNTARPGALGHVPDFGS
jgi:hypothetical protein